MSYEYCYDVMNGEELESIPVYSCDSCYNEIDDSDPRMEIKDVDVHICTDCLEKAFMQLVMMGNTYMAEHILNDLLYKQAMTEGSGREAIPLKLRMEILKKYDFSCVKCRGTERLEIDHIKPVSRGGTNAKRNLQVLCKTCNLKKHAKLEVVK